MEKIDLTSYSDQELSLTVFNDEYLYRMRHNSQFLGYISDNYIFTQEQLEKLLEDLRFNIDDIENYIKSWYDNDSWRSFNMAYDSGFIMLAAYEVWLSGAIDSNYCFEEFKSIEKYIEKQLKKYIKKDLELDRKECFDNAEVWVRTSDNEHAFIRNDYVDYLVNSDELRSWGYIPENEYYKE